ncbi:MAG TPA: tRNA epoxyqueuosine(34) reductase QueG [Aridibacter sp.]|nr:tRNA epoxyqueuosine(34) reductase QueG [Aridibacter sp.]
MSRAIRDLALECGFQKVGFAQADALEEEGRRLEMWLGLGYQGEMRWMEREPSMRADPRKLFDGARSVIALAMNYYTPHEHCGAPGTGKVSRYAWGDDYHEVLRDRMRELLVKIEELIPGVHGKICVDTSPVLDKAWAVRAGIGWLGKHTNVITTDLGSWVFLGEILLDAELEYDSVRVEDHCGSCTACLDACPTGAITEPYLVDSNKCISYATIELRSEDLPEKITENLEGWLYGCDICQDVCPWNRFQEITDERSFEPRPGNVNADLDDLLGLSQEEYAARFRKSAMKRTKLSGLKRNARALLGEGPEV